MNDEKQSHDVQSSPHVYIYSKICVRQLFVSLPLVLRPSLPPAALWPWRVPETFQGVETIDVNTKARERHTDGDSIDILVVTGLAFANGFCCVEKAKRLTRKGVTTTESRPHVCNVLGLGPVPAVLSRGDFCRMSAEAGQAGVKTLIKPPRAELEGTKETSWQCNSAMIKTGRVVPEITPKPFAPNSD